MKRDDPRRDTVRLRHILDAIRDIETILASGRKDAIAELAMERCMEIIGEACRCMSPALRANYPNIPWADIISLRNVIVHEYDKVNINTLWDIAEHKIPTLRDWISGILQTIDKGSK